MKKLILAAALAAVSCGATLAQAAPAGVAEMKYGSGWNNYGPGGDYYMQQRPGPNCYGYPHPAYGWICY